MAENVASQNFFPAFINFLNQLALPGRKVCAGERKHHPRLLAAHAIVHQPQLVQFTVPVSMKLFKTNSKPVREQHLSIKYFFCVCEITRERISQRNVSTNWQQNLRNVSLKLLPMFVKECVVARDNDEHFKNFFVFDVN